MYLYGCLNWRERICCIFPKYIDMQQLNFIKVLAPIFFCEWSFQFNHFRFTEKHMQKKGSHQRIDFNPNILLLKFFVILTKVTGSTHYGKSIFGIFSIFSIFSIVNIEKLLYCFFFSNKPNSVSAEKYMLHM